MNTILLGTYQAHTRGEVEEKFVYYSDHYNYPFVVTKIIWNKNVPESHGYRTYNLYGYKKENVQRLLNI